MEPTIGRRNMTMTWNGQARSDGSSVCWLSVYGHRRLAIMKCEFDYEVHELNLVQRTRACSLILPNTSCRECRDTRTAAAGK